MFLGGKTSNYTVMKMPIPACCASIELKGQPDTKKITNHCCFVFREESILKAVQTKKIYHQSPSGSYRIGLSSENINFEDVHVLYSHDLEMKHRDQELLAT